MKGWRFLWSFPASVLIALVRVYQLTLSPWLGPCCRFEPSCSAYFIQAVEKYGAVRGTLQGAWRICRCNPFCRGGFDPP
ncbi:MAG: membrane protein insertion efficiency factor YidD [Planctomycetales bacterium]